MERNQRGSTRPPNASGRPNPASMIPLRLASDRNAAKPDASPPERSQYASTTLKTHDVGSTTSQPPHAGRAKTRSTATNDRGVNAPRIYRLPATEQVRPAVRSPSEASSCAVRSDSGISQPNVFAPFDEVKSAKGIHDDKGHIGDAQAALAFAGSQFPTDKIKLAADILPRAAVSEPKRMHSVGITPRSRSMTLRVYLTDDSDERKYRLHRS